MVVFGLAVDQAPESALGVLLAADNDFSLDRYNSDANGTYREVGVQIIVQIEYNNRDDWRAPTTPAYTYKVTHQKGSTANDEASYYSDYPDGLTIVQNSGVKIKFVQAGLRHDPDSAPLTTQYDGLKLLKRKTEAVDKHLRKGYAMKALDALDEAHLRAPRRLGREARERVGPPSRRGRPRSPRVRVRGYGRERVHDPQPPDFLRGGG